MVIYLFFAALLNIGLNMTQAAHNAPRCPADVITDDAQFEAHL